MDEKSFLRFVLRHEAVEPRAEVLMMKHRRVCGGVVCLVVAFSALGCGAAPNEEDVASSQAELKKANPRLAQYQETYFRWLFGDKALSNDAFGNAVENNIVMMPTPQAPGDGTPGSIDVTLGTGEGFTIPFFVELGTSYRNGTPPDPFEALSLFTTLDIKFTIDGKTVITSDNVLEYYSQFAFNPAIPYDDAVVQAVIWYQGVALLHNPLPPGKHVLTLDEKNAEPGFGGILEYHNTWNVTVQPGQ
jgi:hypothetical protein